MLQHEQTIMDTKSVQRGLTLGVHKLTSFAEGLIKTPGADSSRTPRDLQEQKPVTFEGGTQRVVISHDPGKRHLLKWDEPIEGTLDGVSVSIDPGEVSLYYFPVVTISDRSIADDQHDDENAQRDSPMALTLDLSNKANTIQLELLSRAIEELGFEMLAKRDTVGACAPIGLVVANNEASLSLAMRLYRKFPRLLCLEHVGADGIDSHFQGETVLHALAANKREDQLRGCLRIARDSLETAELEKLLNLQAVGEFFQRTPMLYFGSTILGYACAFHLKQTIIDLTDEKLKQSVRTSCRLTGFRPVHVAVANNDADMFDFLTGDNDSEGSPMLPLALQSSRGSKTGPGTTRELPAKLTPLQLAAHLGYRSMFEHILRRNVQVNWKWVRRCDTNLTLWPASRTARLAVCIVHPSPRQIRVGPALDSPVLQTRHIDRAPWPNTR